ncbi:MAG TPA: oligosaccharide flippase family protein [Elusimicrobiales bacterium]|nr:oligosaccharide flippase family protein [Elusimicrobiales bacterium]
MKPLAGRLYHGLTGEYPDEGANRFVKNLGWIGFTFAAAKVISALVNIMAGRLLGPDEYGKISVMVSAGAALAPFMLFGLNNAVVRYGVEPARRNATFTLAGAAFAVMASLTALVVLLERERLSSFLGVTPEMMTLSLSYALSTGIFLIAAGTLQAEGSFSLRGLGEIAFSLVMAAVFLGGFFLMGRTYKAMAFSYIAAFGGVGLFLAVRAGLRTRPVLPDRSGAGTILGFSAYSFGGGLSSFFLLNVQALVLNAYLAPGEVGVYAAYYMATINIAAYLGHTVGTVLFPKASASTNRVRLWALAVRTWLRLFPAALLLFLAGGAAVVTLMGREQYRLDPALLLLFSAAGALTMVQNSLGHILFSEGISIARPFMFASWAAGLLNLTGCLLLIPPFGVRGAAVSFIATYALTIAWYFRARRLYMEGPPVSLSPEDAGKSA